MTPLWSPTPQQIAAANITAYSAWLEQTHGLGLGANYDTLWQWSVGELDVFWSSIWEYADVQADGEPTPVFGERGMPGTQWFPRTRLNYAEHVFRDRDPDAPAIHHASELRPLDSWTWRQLTERTAAIAGGLKRLGVGPGDRVVGYLPNLPETAAAFFAVASLGATWSCCSPDFGGRTVADRFAQIEPKVLLAVDGYRYGGRDFDRSTVVDSLAAELPGLEHVVRLSNLGGSGWQDDFVDPTYELEFTRVPFDHPLWILFSSGTTGPPKAIVQGHGGILLEQLKHGLLHLDARAGDRVFWFTTTGWMMWNFLLGVLLTDAEIVLYDGNPGTPDLGTLWQLASDAQVTVFGTSAAYLAANSKAGVRPKEGRDLSRLRAVGSTGSPLSPDGFRWVYQEVGADIWLFSTSGGTDVCTALVTGVPTLPVYEGEIQARALGARVEAWDDDGAQVSSGEVGELVVTEPLPSMPVGFWNDLHGVRYRDSYFETFPGVWRHGDWIEVYERGGCVIRGRSDSTINRGGIRMGTAEIYSAVLSLDEVDDALVIDVPRVGYADGWMPLFVVLRAGAELNDDLVSRIAKRIRSDCSPRHVPNEVREIAVIPRTLSGKVLEVPIKRILMGQDPEKVLSRGSLADPAALDPFLSLAAVFASRPGSEARRLG